MLKILFRDEITESRLYAEVIRDIELAFNRVKLSGTEEEINLLRIIEQAEYNDATSFIDRFGYKLWTTELSSGCKAALCVSYYTNKIVDLIECSLNARDAIINFCSDGTIIIEDNSITIRKLVDNVNVDIDGYKFSDIDEINYYINSVRPFEYIPRNKS